MLLLIQQLDTDLEGHFSSSQLSHSDGFLQWFSDILDFKAV